MGARLEQGCAGLFRDFKSDSILSRPRLGKSCRGGEVEFFLLGRTKRTEEFFDSLILESLRISDLEVRFEQGLRCALHGQFFDSNLSINKSENPGQTGSANLEVRIFPARSRVSG